MRVLVIDNGTSLLEKLRLLIPGDESVVQFNDLSRSPALDFDLVILSGNSVGPLLGNEVQYQREIDFIKNSDKPIIGICFGHELIVYAFGGTLKELSKHEHGITEVRVLAEPTLFNERKSFEVYENHRYGIDVVPEEFTVLAESDHSPEMIRHTHRSIYGLQFHPENYTDSTFGDEVFLNIFKKVSGS